MRYLVMSDIHGGAAEVERGLQYFDKYQCDFIVLLGDLLNHGPRNKVPDTYQPPRVAEVLNAVASKIISVRGNCDSEVDGMMFSFPCNAPYGYLTIADPQAPALQASALQSQAQASRLTKSQRIFLTHGHLHPVKGNAEMSAVAQRDKLGLKEGDIVLSGHTHVSGIFPLENGLININPGSTTLPKGGTKAGFALILEDHIELRDMDDGLVARYDFIFK